MTIELFYILNAALVALVSVGMIVYDYVQNRKERK